MPRKISGCLLAACLIAWSVYTNPALAVNMKIAGKAIAAATSKENPEPFCRDQDTEEWMEYIKTLELYLSQNPD